MSIFFEICQKEVIQFYFAFLKTQLSSISTETELNYRVNDRIYDTDPPITAKNNNIVVKGFERINRQRWPTLNLKKKKITTVILSNHKTDHSF